MTTRAIGLAAVAVLGWGCSGRPPPEPFGSFLTDYEKAWCEGAVRCQLYPDTDLCLALFQPSGGTFPSLDLEAVDAGKARYDATSGLACLQATASEGCADYEEGYLPAACEATFPGGTVPTGGNCAVDGECVAGSFCRSPVQGYAPCRGVCTVLAQDSCNKVTNAPCASGQDCREGNCVATGGLNQPCAGPWYANCGAGLICTQVCADTESDAGSGVSCGGVCIPPGAEGAQCDWAVCMPGGAACMSITTCAPGLACFGNRDAGSLGPFACSQAVASGGSCYDSSDCMSGLACVPGGDGGSLTCGPIPGAGQPCVDSCTGNLFCIPNDADTGSTCLPPATRGQPCSALAQCRTSWWEETNLVCDEANTHTCVTASSTGPCMVLYDTCDPATSFCEPVDGGEAGTCRPFLALGAPCAQPTSCGPASWGCSAPPDGGAATCLPPPICVP